MATGTPQISGSNSAAAATAAAVVAAAVVVISCRTLRCG